MTTNSSSDAGTRGTPGGPAEPVVITVHGQHTIFHPAERATARLTVSFSGAHKDAPFKAAAQATEQLQQQIRSLHDPHTGPVTWWSADQLRTSSHRPWNQDGKQLPLVHSAGTTLAVKFSDFAALSTWLSAVAGMDGVRIDGIDWALTDVVRARLTEQVRIAAVADARDKAAAYAGAAGYPRVTPTAIADVGMLGRGISGSSAPQAFAARAAKAGSSELSLKPEDIEVSAAVDARFRAEPA